MKIICKECKEEGLKYAKGLCFDCYLRLKQRKYSTSNKHKERMRNWRNVNREKMNEASRKHYRTNKEKRKIVLADTKLYVKNIMCEECGERDNLEMHHITYEKPISKTVRSKVTTLCRECHRKLHRRFYNGKRLGKSLDRQKV